jgi:hypothetical protein
MTMPADYALTTFPNTVQHFHDGTVTTFRDDVESPENDAYQAWLAEGGVPDPYVNASAASAIVEQSYRAGLVREADQLQAQGKDYDAIKLLLKANS